MSSARNTCAPGVAIILLLAAAAPALGQTTPQIPPGSTGIRAASIDLSGNTGAPTPGDPGGTGRAFVVFNPNRGSVCYRLSVEGTGPPTAAHIHEGAEGTSGGPVVNFDLPTNGLRGCVSDVDPQLIRRILLNPSEYYVNVHNADYPGGAVRGQLAE